MFVEASRWFEVWLSNQYCVMYLPSTFAAPTISLRECLAVSKASETVQGESCHFYGSHGRENVFRNCFRSGSAHVCAAVGAHVSSCLIRKEHLASTSNISPINSSSLALRHFRSSNLYSLFVLCQRERWMIKNEWLLFRYSSRFTSFSLLKLMNL